MWHNNRNSWSTQIVRSSLLSLSVISLAGCGTLIKKNTLSPKEEQDVLVATLGGIACSESSPLPPPQYRPQFGPGVVPVVVISPRYTQPGRFDLNSAAQSGLGEAVTALEKASPQGGEVQLEGAKLPCDVQPVLNQRWNPGDWDGFRSVFPGGLAWVTISPAAPSPNGDKAYVYSHVQWGPLQGRSDIWFLARDQRGQWSIARVQTVSQS